ncbi:phosphatase [Marinomonas ushuaiensis DSM 15871]|uniref:Phosphatase n=2 Tax=Marinomonas TaxID=28253 RepID=X7EAL7_9GAMM|nr:phosphatase [Marinomonas ushuaiensis DSM 15871]
MIDLLKHHTAFSVLILYQSVFDREISMAFFSYEIDIEQPTRWTLVDMPDKKKGRLALMGFPGLLIGGDSHSFIDPDWLSRTFNKLYENNCRRFYTFAHPDDLPENAYEQAQQAAMAAGIHFQSLPIHDFGIPSLSIASEWQVSVPELLSALNRGESIALSCLSGIGRTGMMAADLLTYMGMNSTEAIQWIRQSKPEAIESTDQENWVGSKTP